MKAQERGKQMKRTALALVLGVVLVSGVAIGGKEKTDSGASKRRWPAKAEKVYVEMTFSGREGDKADSDRFAGSAKVWLDTRRGLYRIAAVLTRTDNGREEAVEAHLLLSPEGCVTWETEKDKLERVRRRDLKSTPGEPPHLEKVHEVAGIMIPFVEAAFEYKRLKTELVMERSKPPVPQADELRWHQIKKKGEKASKLFRRLTLFSDGNVWLGLSPKTGWPMKHVARTEKGKEAIFSVTKLDLKADLKGAFELPAGVKAALEKE